MVNFYSIDNPRPRDISASSQAIQIVQTAKTVATIAKGERCPNLQRKAVYYP